VSDARAAILDCRAIMRDFISGQADYPGFRQRMAAAMGPLDPLDWAIEGLPEELRVEATMYSEWLGGQFGETEDRIPKRPDWVYGHSTTPYGWVDVGAYRKRLREAFAGVFREGT
jgi:hypothetical protein